MNVNPALEIRRVDIVSAVAGALIQSLNAELARTYPEPGACHFRLDAEEVAEGRGAFLVAFENGNPAGCGAVRKIDAESAELKRMYVKPEARGKGIGRAIVSALEAESRRLGVGRMVLETGTRQAAAQALYEKMGFVRVPLLPEYAGSPLSICMEKKLVN